MEILNEKRLETGSGEIRYRINSFRPGCPNLVLLPGLTADHTLFDKQVERFAPSCGVLVWDPPGHGASRPFRLDFSLMDQAVWLHDILCREGIDRPVLIGQSMGGYVAQCYLEKYPGSASGFIAIDSAPLKGGYVSSPEIRLLKKAGPLYRLFPWKVLRSFGIRGCSTTAYGRSLMAHFLDSYSKEEYCHLAGRGSFMLAEALEADLPYTLGCPAVLICGKQDRAGSSKRLCGRWAKKEGLPIHLIPGAGHNANTDRPDTVNRIIEDFLNALKEERI